MNDELSIHEGEPADYEPPAVQDLDTTEGPAVTSAGSSNPV